MHQFVVFQLSGRPYAVALNAVLRATLMVEISPLPGAPAIVSGLINFHGQMVCVVGVRKRLGLPEAEDSLHSQILIVQAGPRILGMVVDEVTGVITLPDAQIAAAQGVYPGMASYVQGVASVAGELIVIHDLSRFLAPEEGQRVDAALQEYLCQVTESSHD